MSLVNLTANKPLVITNSNNRSAANPATATNSATTANLLTNVSIFVAKLLGRNLTKKENIDLIQFAKHYKEKNTLLISLDYYDLLSNSAGLNNRLSDKQLNDKQLSNLSFMVDLDNYNTNDMHELLKTIISESVNEKLIDVNKSIQDIENNKSLTQTTADINIAAVFNINTLADFIKIFNKQATYKKAYLTLDARYANFNTDCTVMTWDYAQTLSLTQNSTNTVVRMKNIVEIKLYSFVMFMEQTGGDPPDVSFITPPYVTILIPEFDSQSFTLPGITSTDPSFNYHFIGMPSYVQYKNPLTDDWAPDSYKHNKMLVQFLYGNNEGIFRFDPPINTLNTISLSIGQISPYNLRKSQFIQCDILVDYGASPEGSIIITLPSNSYYPWYATEVDSTIVTRVLISDFTTTNTVADAAYIIDINTTEFTYAHFISETELLIRPLLIRPQEVDYVTNVYRVPDPAVGPTLIGTPSKVTITLPDYNMVFNMELTYLDSEVE